MKNFRTYELAKNFYLECEKLKLPSYMKNQLNRASLSIVLNLSEGAAKTSAKERTKFYLTSYASFKESQSILDLKNLHSLIHKYDILGAYLFKLSHPSPILPVCRPP